jgi:putative nucleotidyltransferase with HDIG domain
MATLAEAGAAAVGANEVLARVAGYFHDIGKIVKPTYFIENQKGSRSRHDKLAPRMSSLIIAAHVKDGIALAREYKLPKEVIEFIPMHHGTGRIDFFYNKALGLARRDPDETKIDEINEEDYRYPGPKPQTKETGIMMLADTIEAAVRTLDDPSPQKLEAMIDELMKKRIDEGELEECPLTLADLKKIKEAFLGVLVGIYHTRVKYPAAEKKRVRKTPRTPVPPPPDQSALPEDTADAGTVPPSPSPAPPPVPPPASVGRCLPMAIQVPGPERLTGSTGLPPHSRGRNQSWVSMVSVGLGTITLRSTATTVMPAASTSPTVV